MQKKNAGIARSFALKGLLLLAALTLSTGFFACKVAVGGGEGVGTEVPEVTLTFDAGEGSFKDGKTTLTLTGKVGENLALPETPVRKGYDLTGWNPALPEKYPEKDTEYTAVWVTEGDYTITYVNVDGATNENPESYNVETETITLKDPVKPGYTFGGWYKDGGFITKVTEITQGSTGNITLYAKWELVSYTITYALDGGTNAPENPAGYNVETETVTLKDPVKTGYTFAGWYKDGGFITKVTEIPQGTTGDITLYAKWVTDIEDKVFVRGGNATLNGKEVTLSSFWISPYEVTQEEFVSVMTGNKNGIEPNPSYYPDNPAAGEVQERRPVEQVRWYEAIVYCNLLSMREGLTPCYTIKGSTDPAAWGVCPGSGEPDNCNVWNSVTCDFDANGYRLPTEAEWEYAARGGQTGITDGSWEYEYSGSTTLDDVAWYDSNSDSKTHEVGKKQANSLGLYDMNDNVWEWCWDWNDSGSGYPSGTEDPAGPDTGSYRVVRGGSWRYYASGCTVSRRNGISPYSRHYYFIIGVRLVRSAQ